MEFSKEFIEYLYEFWHENYEELCKYCKHDVDCNGKFCEKYEEWYPEKVTFGGVEISKEEQPWAYKKCTCMDLDFGECELLKNSPCNGCMDSNREHFEWNGKIPEDMRCF